MPNPLFAPKTYELPFTSPFDAVGVAKTRSDASSIHNPTTASGGTITSLHPATLTAATEFLTATRNPAESMEPDKLAIGSKEEMILVERIVGDGPTKEIEVVAYEPSTGLIMAGVSSGAGKAPTPYSLKAKSGRDGVAILVAVLTAARTCDELDSQLNELADLMKGTGHIPATEERLSIVGAIISDNIYRRVEGAKTFNEGIGININDIKNTNVPVITGLRIKNGSFSPDTVLTGEFTILERDSTASKSRKAGVPGADLPGMFSFSNRDFSPAEQFLIPTIPSWYVIPNEIVKLCRHAKATTGKSITMRNFMLRGPAGVGKTEGARAIACALNLPYLSLTCNANTEIFDMLGQMLPDVDDNDGVGSSGISNIDTDFHNVSLPTLQDIQMDPATAYEKMTGVYDEDITEDIVYQQLIKTASSITRTDDNKQVGAGQRYKYVDTPLIKAMKHGYCIEIQEPSVIANPGVLVGLNSLLDNTQQITLPTGETITRHPDTVVIVTTNNAYAGCRDVNQSVISRMNLVFDFDEPTDKDMIARAKAVTGCNDDEALDLMVSVIRDIQQRCQETRITDGVCGMRELFSWVQSYMITNDMMESAMFTILSSVSADPEYREDILNTCVKPKIA